MELTPEQLAERNKQAQLARAQELDDLKTVMRTKQGRRFIWRFLSEGGIFRDYADVGNTNATFKLAGRRSLALQFFKEIIEECPELYLEMQREQRVPKSVPR